MEAVKLPCYITAATREQKGLLNAEGVLGYRGLRRLARDVDPACCDRSTEDEKDGATQTLQGRAAGATHRLIGTWVTCVSQVPRDRPVVVCIWLGLLVT